MCTGGILFIGEKYFISLIYASLWLLLKFVIEREIGSLHFIRGSKLIIDWSKEINHIENMLLILIMNRIFEEREKYSKI